ncbi:DarT ssDNA thymidine ADP-ribosyltransferase family protein [Estrella lausannensis]|uniref:Uncharacterized protein n=1 Tax=Estrella lausannensis TaxID=483423 RepID=A0A0H5E7H2_9BACT|nr:DarT ssDNA thymidine ADP-ribosyltransferase family protein [Estrella lausannensis]CRX39290.1 hypothetical protein ELAC_1968 [Estrella lausannensis]
MQGGKEFELKKAVDIMVSNFEKLTPSQQSDQIYVLKERLSYIKNNAGTDQKGAGALLKAVKAYEKKFSEVDGKAITGNAFQNKICQINTAAQMNVFGIASPQSNGDVLLNITHPNAPSRFFTLKQNEHDKTITISELGNPVYSKTIPDDTTTLAAVMAFKSEIVEEMTKAKEALVKKTSDNVETLAGAALKDIEESQRTLSAKKFSLGGRIAHLFKSIGSFFASIPKFFSRISSPATETTQPIVKSRVKLLAGKTKAEGQAPTKTPTAQGVDLTPQLSINQATTVSTGSDFTISPFKERSALTAQDQVITPYDAEKFHYDWQIKNSPLPEDAQKKQIGKATPEELLGMTSRGLSVSAEEFLAAAEKLKSNLPSSGQEGGPQLTTLHDLYCRAADQFEAAGDVTKAFEARANAASFAGPAASSKLHNMSQAVAFGQQAQKSPLLPAHFSGLDTGILKGGSLRASNRTINGNEITQLDFKLSRFARQDLQEHLLNIQNNLAAFEASLPAELKGKVRITEVKDTFLGKKPDGSFAVEDGYTPYEATAIQIEFGGVGSVIIGNNKEFGCLFNNIKVLVKADLPEGKAEQQVHQMLTMLGVGPILNEQRPMDEERLKTALIFRTYYPQQATKMEKTKEFYEMPLDMLRQKIEAEVPEMKDVFKKYEDNPELIEKKEIYPGKTTFSINDIGMLMRKKGAYGLMAGVGSYVPASDAADTVVLMMKYGALASQDRFQAGLFVEGASSEKDLRTGGGDHVFTRLINDKTAKGKLADTYGGDFTFSGTYQMLYDLDVCNTGAYGYKTDEYGVKNPDHNDYSIYAGRKNLPELAEMTDNYNNEIMVKNTVPPAMIRGIVCQTQENKDVLVEKLTAQGVIVDGKINGKPVDSFIHVASKFTKEMWDN